MGGAVGGPAGAAIGGAAGLLGGLLFGGETPEDKERRLTATEALQRQRRMGKYLEKQATATLTPEDIAGQQRIMSVLGPRIGAQAGQRGLAGQPIATNLATKASADALAQLSDQRRGRAQNLLMGMPSGEAYFQQQDLQDRAYQQGLGEIIGMIQSDSGLSQALGSMFPGAELLGGASEAPALGGGALLGGGEGAIFSVPMAGPALNPQTPTDDFVLPQGTTKEQLTAAYRNGQMTAEQYLDAVQQLEGGGGAYG